MDRREVVITPDPQPVEDLPCALEQGMASVRRRDRHELGTPARRSASTLCPEQARVRQLPSVPACPLRLGVGEPPFPEVVGLAQEQA
jgi:hypothetical protein